MKYIALFREHFKKKPVFSIWEVRRFLAKKGITKNYSRLLVHNLVEKKEIHRITRGIYTFENDASVIGFAFSPFYYGLQESLSIRNIWEQETNPVIITTKKVRPGVRNIMNTNVLVRRIGRKMFFGFELIRHYNYWLPVSDIEKTLIDFYYFKETLPKKTLQEMKKKVNRKKIAEYLKKCPKTISVKNIEKDFFGKLKGLGRFTKKDKLQPFSTKTKTKQP